MTDDFTPKHVMEVKPPDDPNHPSAQWETIEQVFGALESPLLAYARRLLGDPGVAEDVVQEAFMRLHMQFSAIQQPQPWLYRAVHNLAVDHQRKTNRLVPFAREDRDGENAAGTANGDETVDSSPIPDEQIARWEGIGLVRLVMETLDDRSKEVIRMRFDEDLSYTDIGKRMGLKVGHVGYLLHHALKSMAVELGKMEVTP